MSVREHMCLSLAGQRFAHGGARDTAIRTQVGMSPVRHAQVVSVLIERPDVLEAYPMLVRRLLRLRDGRRLQRAAAG